MKKLLRTAAAAACLCLLAACAPARQAGGGEPGAPREDFTSVPSGMQAGGEPEAMAAPVAYRAMWVSYLEWPMFDTSGAQGFAASVGSLLDNCAALGLNTVIVQVRPFGDAVYPSAVYPWSHLVTGVQGQDPGYDPLAIFVEQAHARGLAIEAWVNPYRVRLNDTMPPGELAADNPALLHEGWALEANGGLYYDPALPEVQDMVVQGVTEIVQNYDVDGIQFDDYFYPTTDEAFDTESYARYGGGQDLAEWRRANVNTLVQKVYAAVKAVKPEAVFGISPQGNNDNNYSSSIRTWRCGFPRPVMWTTSCRRSTGATIIRCRMARPGSRSRISWTNGWPCPGTIRFRWHSGWAHTVSARGTAPPQRAGSGPAAIIWPIWRARFPCAAQTATRCTVMPACTAAANMRH